MNNSTIKVSVVVPIYNVEKYITKCIQSLLNQTYKSLEIILVDDGSTDCSGVIADEYAKKYQQIKVYHKTNGGLSDARNYGIDHSIGKYIAFVDSDDWVAENFIATLVSLLEENNADLSIIGYYLAFDSGKLLTTTQNYKTRILTHDEAINELFRQKLYMCMAWQKLYKKEIFSNVRFPVGELYEDIAVSLPVFDQCKTVAYVGTPLYYYYQRMGSIVHSGFDKRKLKILDSCDSFIKYSEKNEHKYDESAYSFMLRALILLTKEIYMNASDDNINYERMLREKINKYYNHIWNNQYLNLKNKIVLTLMRYPAFKKIILEAQTVRNLIKKI